MKYCTKCGYENVEGARYCVACGQKLQDQPEEEVPRAKGKISYALAYLGTMFWLPLLTNFGDPQARACANQGLWMLILSVAGCTAMKFLRALNMLLSGIPALPGVVGSLFSSIGRGLYSFIFTALLAFMMFLLANCIKGIHAVNNNEPVHIIPVVGKIHLIHD